MDKKRRITRSIIERYGSVNGCWDRVGKDIGISRTNFYALMAYKTPNPGIETMRRISEICGLSLEETIDDYRTGHRDLWSED